MGQNLTYLDGKFVAHADVDVTQGTAGNVLIKS